MDTIKPAAVFLILCAAFAFNLQLYAGKQGVLYSETKEKDGWHVKCRYFTPFHFYDVEQSIQFVCTDHASVDR